MPAWNPKWLLAAGIATIAFIGLNGVFPGAGLAIAASVALFWAIDTGAFQFVGKGVESLRKSVVG